MLVIVSDTGDLTANRTEKKKSLFSRIHRPENLMIHWEEEKVEGILPTIV